MEQWREKTMDKIHFRLYNRKASGSSDAFGDVPKWLKGPHSKCGRSGNRREGSNPSISAQENPILKGVTFEGFLFPYAISTPVFSWQGQKIATCSYVTIFILYILLSADEPAVIPPAVKDIFYIDRIILDLIKDKIPLLNEHLMIFVRCDIQFLKVMETLGHLVSASSLCGCRFQYP